MEFPLILPLVTLILLWIILGLLSALAYPLISSLTQNLRPDLRSLFQLVYTMLPLIIAVAVALLVFTPFLGGFYLSTHCHGLICDPHVPVFSAGSLYGKLITVLLSGILLIAAGFLGLAIWKNYRAVKALCSLSRNTIDNSYSILETREILACNVGTFNPRVLISRGVLERANTEQMRVIIGHELAHGYRLDNLRRLLVSIAIMPWLKKQGKQLSGDLELSAEQSCDRAVFLISDEGSIVTETIQLVDKWRKGQTEACSNHDSFCAARVEALQTPTDPELDGWKPAAMMFAGSVVFTLTAGDVLHRAAESLLTVVPY